MVTFVIDGYLNGEKKKIDTAKNIDEARRSTNEYRVAYKGRGWKRINYHIVHVQNMEKTNENN